MNILLFATGVALALGVGAANAADKKLVISVYGFSQDAFKELVYTPVRSDVRLRYGGGNRQ